MSVIDYFNKLINYIDELSIRARVTIGKLSTDTESIALNIMPSGNTKYYAGNRVRDLTFQVLSKSASQQKALISLERICDLFEEKNIDVYTEPSYLSEDDKGFIYVASFRTTLE